MTNHFAILGLDPQVASYDDIRAAYRRLAREAHPDQPGGSEEAMRKLTVAWTELRDPIRRATLRNYLAVRATPPARLEDMSESAEQPNDSSGFGALTVARLKRALLDWVTAFRRDERRKRWMSRLSFGLATPPQPASFVAAHVPHSIALSDAGTVLVTFPSRLALGANLVALPKLRHGQQPGVQPLSFSAKHPVVTTLEIGDGATAILFYRPDDPTWPETLPVHLVFDGTDEDHLQEISTYAAA